MRAVRRACIAWALAAALPLGAHALSGTVTRVSDGDTLWLRPADNARPIKLRLRGIDAPELCQPGGPQSRDYLASLVLKRTVDAELHGRDDYGRTLAVLQGPSGDVGAQMVRAGLAWSYRYRGDAGPYAVEEAAAHAAGRGVHAVPGALRPREFRERHGPCDAHRPADG